MHKVAVLALLGLCLPGVLVLAARDRNDTHGDAPRFHPTHSCKGRGYKDVFSSPCPWTYYAFENGQKFKLVTKCYKKTDSSEHAGKGEEGVCLIAHRKRCHQMIEGDESSGGCRGKTVCRNFNYAKVSAFGRDKLQRKSFCIDENDEADKSLKFVGGDIWQMQQGSAPDDVIGSACRGGGVLDVYDSGTCVRPTVEEDGEHFKLDLRCYKQDDESEHAGDGEPGICLVAHGKRCTQRIPGDEESGDCRGATICRHYRFIAWMYPGDKVMPPAPMNKAGGKIQISAPRQKWLAKKSFCIDEKDSQKPVDEVLSDFGEHPVVPDQLNPGDLCWGSSKFDVFRTGTCPTDRELKFNDGSKEVHMYLECFSVADPGVYAHEKQAGRCFIPPGKRCNPDEPYNGFCSEGYMCRQSNSLEADRNAFWCSQGETDLHPYADYFSDEEE